jgi:hypothetical protein
MNGRGGLGQPPARASSRRRVTLCARVFSNRGARGRTGCGHGRSPQLEFSNSRIAHGRGGRRRMRRGPQSTWRRCPRCRQADRRPCRSTGRRRSARRPPEQRSDGQFGDQRIAADSYVAANLTTEQMGWVPQDGTIYLVMFGDRETCKLLRVSWRMVQKKIQTHRGGGGHLELQLLDGQVGLLLGGCQLLWRAPPRSLERRAWAGD